MGCISLNGTRGFHGLAVFGLLEAEFDLKVALNIRSSLPREVATLILFTIDHLFQWVVMENKEKRKRKVGREGMKEAD
jgi:hypothetical protein